MNYVSVPDVDPPTSSLITINKVLPAAAGGNQFTSDNTHFIVKSQRATMMYADNIIVHEPVPPNPAIEGDQGTDGYVRASILVELGLNNVTINIGSLNDLDSPQVEITNMGSTVITGVTPSTWLDM